MSPRTLTVLLIAAAVAASALPAQAATLVATGDSVVVGTGASDPAVTGVVPRYLQRLRAAGVADEAVNVARRGETTSTYLSGGQFDAAIAAIDASSDVTVVVLGIGGNDTKDFACVSPSSAACPIAANLRPILSGLRDALVRDSGAEHLRILEYYNPKQGGPLEAAATQVLLGVDGRIDCAGSGGQIGVNDLIACIGRAYGAISADPWPAFLGRLDLLVGDGQHVNDGGQEVLVDALVAAEGPDVESVPVTAWPAPVVLDSTAPVLGRVALSPTRISRGTPVRARVVLSEPATVVFAVGGRSTTVRGGPGPVAAVLRTPRLAPGRYRLTVVATDTAGNVARGAASLTVVRRPARSRRG